MTSLVVNLIVRAAHRWAVPASIRAAKRFPVLAAGGAVTGQAFGVWLIGEAEGWPMVALGVLMAAGYTFALGLVAVKWWSGTWCAFCDYVASVAE